ncbi:hypothetical protein [Thermoleptolyngbya sp. C42_A2020_037]|nr:hypothetical protein [Thermoleptolyngbya sp. C42_A2020_037]
MILIRFSMGGDRSVCLGGFGTSWVILGRSPQTFSIYLAFCRPQT